ncbi:MAG: FAD:protein FMN transferase [Bacteroidales bacterium]|nr:FAD:protein FMN transferase [Bacteroidales bacterium]
MKRALIYMLVMLALAACSPGKRYIRIDGYAQGGTYCVKLCVDSVSASPEEIRDSVEAILHCIDTTLSGYNKGSLLSRLNRGETVQATPMLREMYALAYQWFEASGGALDFAAGPLYDAWGFGFREGRLPSPDTVAAILSTCGMKHLAPELPDGEIILPKGLSLNFNAIAQGYTCDKVAAYLYRIGVKDMLVDIGEIWCDGLNPAGKPWSVGIDRPFDRPTDGTDSAGEDLDGVWSSKGAPVGIVTSGNYRKYYVKDGKKYAHTIDPRSGYPVEHQLLSASVTSRRSSADADALATLCMVLGPVEAKALILSMEGVEAYLISSDGEGGMTEWASPGFTLKEN